MIKIQSYLKITLLVLLSLSLVACNDDDDDDDDADNNAPAFQSSWEDIKVAENTIGVIYIAQATDADGNTIEYSLAGGEDRSQFSISATSGELYFQSPPDYENPSDSDQNNKYEVEIRASDDIDTTTMVLIVEVTDVDEDDANEAPIAVISVSPDPDTSDITTDTLVTLDGSGSSDPDGDELTYSWSQPSGQGISLSSTNGVSTSFTAATAGTYTFTLTVSDGELSDSATVTITVGDVNRAPIADIDVSPDADITTATQVTLDGSDSYDPDGDLITYNWSQPSGQGIVLSLADINDQSIANFTASSAGTYTFTLTVSDGLLSDSEVVIVTVGDVNQAPIADIDVILDPNTEVITTETQVTLDGSSSYDPDGDPISSYTWSQPSTQNISLSTTNGTSTNFTATSAGTYTFTLTVSDGDLSGSSEVIVVVHPVTIPSDFSATAGDSEVILTWTPYSDETTYSIYRSTDPNCDPAAANVSTNCSDGAEFPGVDSGLADTGLTNGTTYYYWIEATLDGVIQRSVAPISATPQEPTTGIVATGALNDTGIDWGGDYESGNNADCSSNIDATQDCDHGRDATHDDDSDGHAGFSFTKLDSSGNPLAASATEWSCVQDNVTGLIWEVKTDDGGIHDKDNRYRWGGVSAIGSANREGTYYDDWDSLVNGANSTELCGFDDWRVPDIEELRSIVDYSRYYPSIDVDYFPNTESYRYWSASPNANDSGDAWLLYFHYGYDFNYYRSYDSHVRLVRVGQ